MAETPPRRDKLKTLLDKLAIKAVTNVLEDAEATPRGMADVLKVASGYYALSRKPGSEPAPPSAWDAYQKAFLNGKDHDAEADEA